MIHLITVLGFISALGNTVDMFNWRRNEPSCFLSLIVVEYRVKSTDLHELNIQKENDLRKLWTGEYLLRKVAPLLTCVPFLLCV